MELRHIWSRKNYFVFLPPSPASPPPQSTPQFRQPVFFLELKTLKNENSKQQAWSTFTGAHHEMAAGEELCGILSSWRSVTWLWWYVLLVWNYCAKRGQGEIKLFWNQRQCCFCCLLGLGWQETTDRICRNTCHNGQFLSFQAGHTLTWLP
jgi:hypothetical protein